MPKAVAKAEEAPYVVIRHDDGWESTVEVLSPEVGMRNPSRSRLNRYTLDNKGTVRIYSALGHWHGQVVPRECWLVNRSGGLSVRAFTSQDEMDNETRKIEDPYKYLVGSRKVVQRWAQHNLPPGIYSVSGIRTGDEWEFFLTDTRVMHDRNPTSHRIPHDELGLFLGNTASPGLVRVNTWDEEAYAEHRRQTSLEFMTDGLDDDEDTDDWEDDNFLDDDEEPPDPMDDDEYDQIHRGLGDVDLG